MGGAESEYSRGGEKTYQLASVLIITSAVGIYAPPACADKTQRQKESGGQRKHRLKRSTAA